MATLNVNRVLVPTDFSEASQVALEYAVAVAEAFEASLHLLHVVERLPSDVWQSSSAVPAGLYEEVERGAREGVNRLLTEQQRTRLRVQSAVQAGKPFLEIIRYARDHDIDLIVMGTHGRGPVVQLLMGSVAEKVVRKAPCPVLTVRPPQHDSRTP